MYAQYAVASGYCSITFSSFSRHVFVDEEFIVLCLFFNSIKTRSQFDCDSESADLADYLTNKLGTEVYVDMNPYQKTVRFGVSFVEDPD